MVMSCKQKQSSAEVLESEKNEKGTDDKYFCQIKRHIHVTKIIMEGRIEDRQKREP